MEIAIGVLGAFLGRSRSSQELPKKVTRGNTDFWLSGGSGTTHLGRTLVPFWGDFGVILEYMFNQNYHTPW